MRLVSNQKLIDRNVAIGKYAFGAGMALLLGAFAVNLYALSRPEEPRLVVYAFGAFIGGFTLTSLGTIFNNRYGRRPDRGLADALKGLDDRYSLYHYRLGAQHVLIGPSGAVVLVPKYQLGAIAYTNGRWHHPGAPRGFLFGLFARDPLGNPSAEAAAEGEALARFLNRRAPGAGLVPQAIVVFMHPRAEVSAREAPVPAVHVKQLKDYVRRLPKSATLAGEALAELESAAGIPAG